MQFDESLPWRRIRGDGFNAHAGPADIAPLGDGVYMTTMLVEDRHINIGGVCHGGVLLWLADTSMGAASFDAGGGHPCATIEMDCHFIAAAKKGGRLLCRAEQLRRVRGLSFMECEIWSEGRRVARASGIWKYLESKAPGVSGP